MSHTKEQLQYEEEQPKKTSYEVIADPTIPTKVVTHVIENQVEPTHDSSICVDGGYQPHEAGGELARAGADLGLSLAIMQQGYTAHEAFLAVYNFRISKEQQYGWHSDTHVDSKDTTTNHETGAAICGCGHCNAAFHHSQKYNVNAKQVTELLSIINQYQQEHPENMRFINLDRDHQEEGIIVVKSAKFTLLPWDQDANHQFFIYDQAREEILVRDLVAYMQLQDDQTNITVETLLKTIDKHTNVTLGLLGSSRGKPMYGANLETRNGTLKITLEKIGNAPVIN